MVATTNPMKMLEIRTILTAEGFTVRWLRLPLQEIQADSLAKVARAKLDGVPTSLENVLVEDTGLFIESLKGFPGVYTSYAVRTIGVPGLLRLVEGLNRRAEFRTAMGLRVGGRILIREDCVRGAISKRPLGRSGYALDRIFVPNGSHVTLGQIPLLRREKLAHRTQAIRKLVQRIITA